MLSTAGGWWPVLVMNNADGWSPANIVMVVTRGVACPLLCCVCVGWVMNNQENDKFLFDYTTATH